MTAPANETFPEVDHARRFGGFRDAWEAAVANGYPVRDLAEVARQLAGIDPAKHREDGYWIEDEPRFKLRPKERRAITIRLLETGVDPKRIPAAVCPSRTTLWRIVQELGSEGLTTPPEPAPQAGLRVSKRPDPTDTPDPPVPFLPGPVGGSSATDLDDVIRVIRGGETRR